MSGSVPIDNRTQPTKKSLTCCRHARDRTRKRGTRDWAPGVSPGGAPRLCMYHLFPVSLVPSSPIQEGIMQTLGTLSRTLFSRTITLTTLLGLFAAPGALLAQNQTKDPLVDQ